MSGDVSTHPLKHDVVNLHQSGFATLRGTINPVKQEWLGLETNSERLQRCINPGLGLKQKRLFERFALKVFSEFPGQLTFLPLQE